MGLKSGDTISVNGVPIIIKYVSPNLKGVLGSKKIKLVSDSHNTAVLSCGVLKEIVDEEKALDIGEEEALQDDVEKGSRHL